MHLNHPHRAKYAVSPSAPRNRGVRASRPFFLAALLTLTGCMSYRTPGAGVNLANLQASDQSIQVAFEQKPVAPFPARVAFVRVQAPEYRSYRNDSYGRGRYSVVLERDVETEADLLRLKKLAMISDVAPLNRMLLPATLESDKDLRLAAARLQCDLVLAYTFDTRFRNDKLDVGPLELLTLGAIPNHEARVTSTASAAFFDSRSGYVYGVVESTATEKQLSTAWGTRDAVDDARLRAERAAFDGLLREVETLWKGIVEQHAGTRRPAPVSPMTPAAAATQP